MYALAPVSDGGMLKSPTMQAVISLCSFVLTYFAALLLGTYMGKDGASSGEMAS